MENWFVNCMREIEKMKSSIIQLNEINELLVRLKKKVNEELDKHWECKEPCITAQLTGKYYCKDCPIKKKGG